MEEQVLSSTSTFCVNSWVEALRILKYGKFLKIIIYIYIYIYIYQDKTAYTDTDQCIFITLAQPLAHVSEWKYTMAGSLRIISCVLSCGRTSSAFLRKASFVKSLIVSARHDSLSQLQYKLCKHVFSNVCWWTLIMNIVKWHNTKVTMLILKLGLNSIITSQSPWFLQILHVPAYRLCQV